MVFGPNYWRSLSWGFTAEECCDGPIKENKLLWAHSEIITGRGYTILFGEGGGGKCWGGHTNIWKNSIYSSSYTQKGLKTLYPNALSILNFYMFWYAVRFGQILKGHREFTKCWRGMFKFWLAWNPNHPPPVKVSAAVL